MTKHKWHKEIKAWADGAEIEFRYVGHSDYFRKYKEWNTDEQHNFFDDGDWEYRIKPQPKEPQYLYVYKAMGGEVMIESKPSAYCGDCIGKIKLEQDDD